MGLLGHFRGPDGHRAADLFQLCLKTSALGVRVSCECGSHVGRVLTGGSLYAFGLNGLLLVWCVQPPRSQLSVLV